MSERQDQKRSEKYVADRDRAHGLAEPTIERWREMPNREAYVESMIVSAAFVAYRAGREDAAREIEAELEDQQRRSDEHTAKSVRAKLEDLPAMRAHGWELHGRVVALTEAVQIARGSSGSDERRDSNG